MADQTEANSNEQKPNVGGEQSLTLTVKGQDGNSMQFKVKSTTPFKKIFSAFCQRTSQNPDSLVFLFDGERLRDSQTVGEMEMEDGDSIDVMIHQQGGC